MKKPFKDSKASWYDDFVRNRKIITVHLHILHPAIRSNKVRKPVKKALKNGRKKGPKWIKKALDLIFGPKNFRISQNYE